MMKRFLFLCLVPAALVGLVPSSVIAQTAQQLAFAGLLSSGHQGQFNGVQTDASGNLYLLLDQKDGVRVLKTDAAATTALAQAHIGAHGDIGIALCLDPAGNVYVTGTTTSGSLAGTSGTAFPSVADTSTNSFVAKFDSNLNTLFVTFAGSGRTAASAIAATSDAVFIAGSTFTNTIPVTPSGIQQSPASSSFQNGFVERFNSTGTTLVYATYLTGLNGDTAPAAIVADSSDNAYVAGYTTSTGYPTLSAVVPSILSNPSGFLTKLTPAGDGIVFSTFVPGDGITSLAIDTASQNLLLSGTIALGKFPVVSVSAPVANTAYQSLIRMPLDGSTVLSSTLLAPGSQSTITPAADGNAWVAQALSTPLLPTGALSTIGGSALLRVNAQSAIDQAARFGGLPTTNPGYASVPVSLISLAEDSAGQPIAAGTVSPTASSSLL
ncbi:MAG TPA: SBBP repeat-containing protein, partial [Edaphobacter sp.]